MIHSFMSAGYGSNTYLVAGEKKALIDSGTNPASALAKISSLGGLEYLVNTHCHFDHIAGNKEVKAKTNAKLCAHVIDAAAIEQGSGDTLADLFGENLDGVKVDVRLEDGSRIDLGDIQLEVIHTPGHTPGGICLYEPGSKSLFSGDTVFADGVGRTDFAGGSMDALGKSLEKLLELCQSKGVQTIYPGHGPIGEAEALERIYHMYF